MAFTPVSELGTDQWSVSLPEFVDTSKIGVDFDRLSMISRVGCFSGHVSIRGFSGETSQYQPMIVGDDSQGSAYAGAGSVKQASLGESEPIAGHELRYFYHRQAPPNAPC